MIGYKLTHISVKYKIRKLQYLYKPNVYFKR